MLSPINFYAAVLFPCHWWGWGANLNLLQRFLEIDAMSQRPLGAGVGGTWGLGLIDYQYLFGQGLRAKTPSGRLEQPAGQVGSMQADKGLAP